MCPCTSSVSLPNAVPASAAAARTAHHRAIRPNEFIFSPFFTTCVPAGECEQQGSSRRTVKIHHHRCRGAAHYHVPQLTFAVWNPLRALILCFYPCSPVVSFAASLCSTAM